MLARVPGLHAGRLAPSADPLALTGESRTALASLGLGDAAIAALRHPDAAALARDEAWLAGPNRRLVTWGSADYPPLLAATADAPLVLFVEGTAATLSLPQLAIVGSRNPTRSAATPPAVRPHLAGAGLAITSGLALGIDAAAHRGALAAGGRTVAVLRRGPRHRVPARARGARAGSSPRAARWSPSSPPARRPLAELSAAQPPHQRPGHRHAGGRGRLQQRFADHGAPRHRAGTRGLRDPGLDTQPDGTRLPPPDPPGREAGGDRG